MSRSHDSSEDDCQSECCHSGSTKSTGTTCTSRDKCNSTCHSSNHKSGSCSCNSQSGSCSDDSHSECCSGSCHECHSESCCSSHSKSKTHDSECPSQSQYESSSYSYEDDLSKPVATYDVIIVGAGTSGLALANRLSSNTNITVAVVDCGRDDVRDPPTLPSPTSKPNVTYETTYWDRLIDGGLVTYAHRLRTGFSEWQHQPRRRDAPESECIPYPRGAGIAGSSRCLLGTFLRGSHTTFNAWDKLGFHLWGYPEVLPYFKKVENRSQTKHDGSLYYDPRNQSGYNNFDKRIHGRKGNVFLLSPYYNDPFGSSIIAATRRLGFDVDIDPDNPCSEVGLFPTPLSLYDQEGTRYDKLRKKYNLGDPYVLPPNYAQIGLAGAKTKTRRVSSAEAYLYGAETRKNLTIIKDAFVTEVVLDRGRAVGVAVLTGNNIYATGRNINTAEAGFGGTPHDAKQNAQNTKCDGAHWIKANKLVVLCAGSFHTPQILMLSGIGPACHLKEMGIPVIRDVPEVGKHCVDHGEIDIAIETKECYDPMLYACNGIIPKATSQTLRFKSREELGSYDHQLQIMWMGASIGRGGLTDLTESVFDSIPGWSNHVGTPQYIYTKGKQKLQKSADPRRHFCATLSQQVSLSEGFIKLKSKDPTEEADIVMNLFEHKKDLSAFVDAFQHVVVPLIENLGDPAKGTFFREGGPTKDSPISTIPGGTGFFKRWVWPPENEFRTNGKFDRRKFKRFVREFCWGKNASGTCQMGAVVDQRGCVCGVSNLRICDCSIQPIIASADTQCVAYMIGLRMADLIMEDYGWRRSK